MNKNVILFPGGAGGNWLSHLIYCLEKNIKIFVSDKFKNLNFHNKTKTRSIELTHDITVQDCKIFSGNALFNIYLNVLHKLRYKELNLKRFPVNFRFETMANETASKLEFQSLKADLNWNYLFTDNERFSLQLFELLDNFKIQYTKNYQTVKESIDIYVNTCIDASLYFDNWNEEIWLGWCLGIMKYENNICPIVHSVNEAYDFLYPNRRYFLEYSMNKCLKTDEK